jgi:hypothetical protein
MSKLRIILLTIAVAFPAGVLADRAVRRHENLRKADVSLDEALRHVRASQKANEWREGGHAEEAIELIEKAKHQVHEAAEYDEHR